MADPKSSFERFTEPFMFGAFAAYLASAGIDIIGLEREVEQVSARAAFFSTTAITMVHAFSAAAKEKAVKQEVQLLDEQLEFIGQEQSAPSMPKIMP